FVEPVGVDEPREVVVRRGANGGPEGELLGRGHRKNPGRASLQSEILPHARKPHDPPAASPLSQRVVTVSNVHPTNSNRNANPDRGRRFPSRPTVTDSQNTPSETYQCPRFPPAAHPTSPDCPRRRRRVLTSAAVAVGPESHAGP